MKKIIFIFTAVFLFSLSVLPALSQTDEGYDFGDSSGLNRTASESGYLNTVFNSAESIESGVGSIIAIVLSFLGIVFLILMIVGGIQWMTAGGNDERVSKAKSLITNAAIGVVIVFSAYAITWFIVRVLMDKTLMFG
ncbi:MAG: pilin [Candidatus Pacebacteria bacterium]|nr:pilin [Candidatus Paceibacterota bacterium]